MRHPPLFLDKVPDERLQLLMEEAIRSESTLEFLVAIYRVIKPEMIRSLKKYLSEANPLVDLPTYRTLKLILDEDEMMLQWGQFILKQCRAFLLRLYESYEALCYATVPEWACFVIANSRRGNWEMSRNTNNALPTSYWEEQGLKSLLSRYLGSDPHIIFSCGLLPVLE
jgi:hypothetical protein